MVAHGIFLLLDLRRRGDDGVGDNACFAACCFAEEAMKNPVPYGNLLDNPVPWIVGFGGSVDGADEVMPRALRVSAYDFHPDHWGWWRLEKEGWLAGLDRGGQGSDLSQEGLETNVDIERCFAKPSFDCQIVINGDFKHR